MDEVLAVGAEKDIGVELGFQLVERIRHGLGRAVFRQRSVLRSSKAMWLISFTCTEI